MSAAAELQAALVAALAGAEGIAGVAAVFDAVPARAALPYIVIGDGLAFDWSHKSGRGREHRIALSLWDEGGRTARLQALMAAVGAAIEALAPDLPTNRIASIALLRERLVRDPAGPWAGLIEYRVRTLES